ncbi:MAG: dTMP kinase [Clostridia bacterium]|nr:dTMP kinase [Clostridia bacterium]
MYKNKEIGKLIAFDGPNGAGKSTLIREVQARLSEMNINVHVTKEPSDSKIGTFTRNTAELFSGNTLACLVAADRYAHIEREILPRLKQETIVITDRYILSSLILQPMDGVDPLFVKKVNDEIMLPDLQIAVWANEEVLQMRLSERYKLTRFEKNNRSVEELKNMKNGVHIIQEWDVPIVNVFNDGDFEENISLIVENILSVI